MPGWPCSTIPIADQGGKRLLLVTDYDGSWRDHVLELAALTSEPDAIWGCCDGYSGSDHFPEFIRDHMVAPQAYYIAFRDLTIGADPPPAQAAGGGDGPAQRLAALTADRGRQDYCSTTSPVFRP